MSDAFTRQVQDFTRQAQQMFSAGKDAKIPENMSAFAEDAVAKSREVYNKMTAATKDNAKVVEDVLLTAQAGAKSIGEKLIANTIANTDAAFDAAQAMAKAKTFLQFSSVSLVIWPWTASLHWLAQSCLWLAVVVAWVSALQYIRAGSRATSMGD